MYFCRPCTLYGGRLCFHSCRSVHREGGVPLVLSLVLSKVLSGVGGGGVFPVPVTGPVWGKGVSPRQEYLPPDWTGGGYLPSWTGQGKSPPIHRTCYNAGGTPLAVTQEDFLVNSLYFLRAPTHNCLCIYSIYLIKVVFFIEILPSVVELIFCALVNILRGLVSKTVTQMEGHL